MCRFYAIISISGAVSAILASEVGSVHAEFLVVLCLAQLAGLIWVAQIASLSILPLAALLCLEHGIVSGAWRTLYVVLAAGSILYECNMQTKAYSFDRSMLFGGADRGCRKLGEPELAAAEQESLMSKHVAFTHTFRAVADSREY